LGGWFSQDKNILILLAKFRVMACFLGFFYPNELRVNKRRFLSLIIDKFYFGFYFAAKKLVEAYKVRNYWVSLKIIHGVL